MSMWLWPESHVNQLLKRLVSYCSQSFIHFHIAIYYANCITDYLHKSKAVYFTQNHSAFSILKLTKCC